MDCGQFPFGQPNTVRPSRKVTNPTAVVIGVYPSAFHVSWKVPTYLQDNERRGRVGALAVDVEPTVFWSGIDPDEDTRLEKWLKRVGFKEGDAPGQHGHVSRKLPAANGSSGRKVVRHYLDPLGLSEEKVAFTDVYPVFMIKGGQRTVIRREYDPIADQLGLQPSTLPNRIAAKDLPAKAIEDFGGWLRQELELWSPQEVITLGEETWHTVAELFGRDADTPLSSFQDAYSDYGKPGTIRLGGRIVTWWALIHPGLIRGEPRIPLTVDELRSVAGWSQRHFKWESDVRRRV